MKTSKPMLEYLATCSTISLQSFQLARLNDRANLRKELIDVVDELIEADIQSRIAEWILVYRQQQDALPRRGRRPRRRPALDLDDLTLPLLPAESTPHSRRDEDDDNDEESPSTQRKPIAPHRVRRISRTPVRKLAHGLF